MGSTRLPGKVMREFCGRPMVWHIGDRLRRVDGIDELVMATTADARNAPLAAFAEQDGMAVFRAELEDDIAGRLAGAMRLTEADAIMEDQRRLPRWSIRQSCSACSTASSRQATPTMCRTR